MAAQIKENIESKQTLIFGQSVRVQFRQKELGWFVANSMRKLKKIYEKFIQIVTISNIRETLYSILYLVLWCAGQSGCPIFPNFGIFWNIVSNLRFCPFWDFKQDLCLTI